MTRIAAASDLIVAQLSPEQVGTVFPLMRAADPSLSLAGWQRFARRVARGGAMAQEGVLTARRIGLPHPCGAVCYRRTRGMHDGAMLTAEHFIALDLLHPEHILKALIAGLEPVAHRLGCATIRSIVHGDVSGGDVSGGDLSRNANTGEKGGLRGGAAHLIENLHLQGHVSEAVILTKLLPPSAKH